MVETGIAVCTSARNVWNTCIGYGARNEWSGGLETVNVRATPELEERPLEQPHQLCMWNAFLSTFWLHILCLNGLHDTMLLRWRLPVYVSFHWRAWSGRAWVSVLVTAILHAKATNSCAAVQKFVRSTCQTGVCTVASATCSGSLTVMAHKSLLTGRNLNAFRNSSLQCTSRKCAIGT